jgi:hypothetical protein
MTTSLRVITGQTNPRAVAQPHIHMNQGNREKL